VCQQAQCLVEANESRLGEDGLMGDIAADAVSQEPVHLFPIPSAVVALELISGEAKTIVEGYLDARFFADFSAGGVSGDLALLDVAFRKCPLMTATYQKTRPFVDYDCTRRMVKHVSRSGRDQQTHSSASINKDGLRTSSPEAITRASGKLRELHRAFNC
jgi:hypothetical protein